VENLTTGLMAWLGDHSQWLGPAIFLIALIESLAVAGLLVPGVVLLVAVTAMAGSGNLDIFAALTWAFAGAVCGDLLSFALGRVFHQDIKRLAMFRRNPQWIEGGEAFFRRYGILSVIIGRFVGPVRPVIPMVAGMLDMPVLRFVLVNLLSALAWAPVYVLPGYMAGQAVHWPVPAFFWTQASALGAGLAVWAFATLMVLKTQERWAPLVASALALACLPLLHYVHPWLTIFQDTVTDWLTLSAAEFSGATAYLVATVTQPLFLLWLVLLPATALAVTMHWRQLIFLLLTLLLSMISAVAVGLALPSMTLAGSLAVTICLVVVCNRDQGFWRRTCWLVGMLPVLALLLTAHLVSLSITPLSAVASLLVACAASLLSLWLVDRGSVMATMPLPMRCLLPLWPIIAALLAGLVG